MDCLPSPNTDLIRRGWEGSPNATFILRWTSLLDDLTPREQALFTVALQLEEGDLPWIEQNGFARFDPVDAADHRLLKSEAEKGDLTYVDTDPTEGSTSRAPQGAAGRRTATETEETEAGASVRGRQHSRRVYRNVGEVMDEDGWELGAMFPGFSPPIYDQIIGLFYREGVIQPLRWWPAPFRVRLYYEESPWLLPIVRIAPSPTAKTPHVFQIKRNGIRFPAVCYTFAPDGTIVRGRSWDDTSTEVLRQVVVWLLRYIVWRRFGFFPGVGVAHNPAELLAIVESSDPCPYHADRPYGACCRPRHALQVSQRKRKRAALSDLRYGVLDPRTRRR